MREKKFRCWNTDKNEMQWLEFDDDWTFYKGELCHRNAPLYPVMQYTGLKDKNGKEIYSGDILKVHTHIKPLLVEWKGVETNKGMMFGYLIDLSAYGYNDGKGVEVIGNIYENHKLLNKDN